MTSSFLKKSASVVTTLAIIGGISLPFMTHAAQITTASDTLSTLKAGEAANHEVKFVIPSTVDTLNNGVIVDYDNLFDVSNLVYTDIDFAVGDSNNCSTATFTEKTLAATASGSTWGVEFYSAQSAIGIMTDTDSFTNKCARIRIGTNATVGATGTNQIVNPATANSNPGYQAEILSSDDSTSIAIPILDNNEVQVTASVDPQISFALSTNTLEFGSLTVGNDRYATVSGGDTNETAGLTLTASTNASNGYSISVTGNTLESTNGYNVDAIGGTASALTTGELFGLRANVTSGTGTESTPFDGSNYAFTPATVQELVSATGPADTTEIDVYYGANITATTQSADYAATHTYVMTGNF